MKTRNLKLMLSIALMGAVFAAAGQPARDSGNDNRNKNYNRKESLKPEKKSNYRENAHYRGESRPVQKELHHRSPARDIRRAEPGPGYRADAVRPGAKAPDHFKGNKHYRYIPRYGHTVKHFSGKPVVFHTGTSRYYFHDNHFYRYHNGIGYIWIDNPYGMVFPSLPRGSVLVHINGRPFYRYGSVYFVNHRHGFEVVSLPVRYQIARPVIHISASF